MSETKHTPESLSQCQVIGEPRVKTWEDYRRGCLATFGGGHHSDGMLTAFQQGMQTIFNLLESEFPPAEDCRKNAEELAELRAQRDKFREVVCFAANAYDDELSTGALADKLYDVSAFSRATLAQCEKGQS